MSGCSVCGGFGDRHDPIAHGEELIAVTDQLTRLTEDMGLYDDRAPKPCPICGETCTYDGWDHVHRNGIGIGSCKRERRDDEAYVSDDGVHFGDYR